MTTLRILAWNVHQQANDKPNRIIELLSGSEAVTNSWTPPHVIVLTDVNFDPVASHNLCRQLAESGWAWQEPSGADAVSSKVLIGATTYVQRGPRMPCVATPQDDPAWLPDDTISTDDWSIVQEELQRRWVEVVLPTCTVNGQALHIAGLYAPQATPKRRFSRQGEVQGTVVKAYIWRRIVAHVTAHADAPYVIAGDLNTGINPPTSARISAQGRQATPDIVRHHAPSGQPTFVSALPASAISTRFCVEDGHLALLDSGWTDTWRYLHPITPGYTWRGAVHGFRLDAILVSPVLRQAILGAAHIPHEPHRLPFDDNTFDHKAAVADIIVDGT